MFLLIFYEKGKRSLHTISDIYHVTTVFDMYKVMYGFRPRRREEVVVYILLVDTL